MFLQRIITLCSFIFLCSFSTPALASQATFSWIPNNEANLSGYKVHFGISSRNYTNVIDVGLPTPVDGRIQATIDTLVEGNTYYFSATAYDDTGIESDFSEEIIYTVANSDATALPVAADSSASGNEDSSISGALEVSNPSTLPLQYTVTTSSTYGTLTVEDTTGQFTYQPLSDFNGQDTFSFSATNDNGTSNIATVTITVTAVNDAPIAENTSVTTNEDFTVNGQLSATDTDQDTLSYSLKTAATHGIATVATTGEFTYTPNDNWNGTDTFTFTANDGSGDSNIAVVTMTVTPVNDPPTAQTANLTTNEDTAVNGQLSATDTDQDSLSYALAAQAGNGTVTLSVNGTFTYTPVANWNGTDSFTFTANDGTTDSNTATVTLTVTAINDAPVATDQFISVDAGISFQGQVTAVDQEGDLLNFTIKSTPSSGTVTLNSGGSYTYIADQNAEGTDSFSYTANDGSSDSSSATVSITITKQAPSFRFELSEIEADSNWQTVRFESPFTNPVVIARATSFNDSETGVVRVKNVNSTGFDLRFQEWDSLDDQHPAETITVIVVEQGTFTLENGAQVEAGCFSTSGASSFNTLFFQQGMTVAPVVMAAVTTVNEEDAVTGRIRNITVNGFDFMMREQELNSTTHAEETGCYLAWEPSTGALGDMQYEVATTADQITGNSFTITYDNQFIELPLMLAAMQTTDGADTSVLRISNKNLEGMSVFVSEEQSRDTELAHTTERGAYIAIAPYNPLGDPDGDNLNTIDEEDIYNTHPGLADTDHDGMDDGAEISFWQEQGSSWDSDIDNDGLINLLDQDSDNDGMADGSEVAAGYDPSDSSSFPAFPIMEGGEVDVASTWVRVTLDSTYANPVIIARLVSQNDSEPCVVRVENVTSSSFELRLQEYGYQDGSHPVEQVSYLVMEAGHYTLADGTQVEAGTFSTNATSSYTNRDFKHNFELTPVVITSIASFNEADTVTARIRNISQTSFELKLQEQELNTRNHINENLAYIAWEPSRGTGNGIQYEVAQSTNTITHAVSTMDYASGFSTKPLLYTGMQTTDGGDTSILRTVATAADSLQVMVEEEQSRDSEIYHTTEIAGFIAILAQ